MAEPTLSQVFGAGATQTASSISISKADLATVGLTASATNTAESLLAAIVLLAKNALTDTNFEANLDQSITILPGFNSIVQRPDGSGGFLEYRQFQWQFNAHKLDNTSLDPDEL
jgi:hypothetical protein